MTAKEKLELEKRKNGFDAFRKERMPILHGFAEILGCENPHEILIAPEKFLYYIDGYMEMQDVTNANRTWLLTRIGYFIGEFLISKFGGCWMVDEGVGSKTFARYVVGEFEGEAEKVIDPFFFAQTYVDTPPPRSLIEQVDAATNS